MVGDLYLVIYQVPSTNLFLWVACAILSVVGVVGSIITWLASRKKANVWRMED